MPKELDKETQLRIKEKYRDISEQIARLEAHLVKLKYYLSKRDINSVLESSIDAKTELEKIDNDCESILDLSEI